MSPLDFDTYVF